MAPLPHSVEHLRRDELAQVAEIEGLVFPEPLELEALHDLFDAPSTEYLCVRREDRLAAYFGFQCFGPICHVISNATHPDFTSQGMATSLLESARAVALAHGARWFLGEVRVSNARQRKLLAHLGWAEVGTCPTFFGNGEDAVIVWRLL